MGFLPSSGCVSTTLWMHHMDADKTHREEAMNYIEQILKAMPRKTAAVQPLTSYLKNHQSKMHEICGTQLEKQGQTHK